MAKHSWISTEKLVLELLAVTIVAAAGQRRMVEMTADGNSIG